MVAAAPTKNKLQVAIGHVSGKYAEFISIITTDAALELPKHLAYNHAIDFKNGTITPW